MILELDPLVEAALVRKAELCDRTVEEVAGLVLSRVLVEE
jgi:hypothetical protein